MGKPQQDYPAFPKIPRFNREVIVTEKIDGTNSQIEIVEDDGLWTVRAGSRNRWLTLEADNFGFARWVEENRSSLIQDLGPGNHFGEWYGQGIQRTYGLNEKRFMLFNTSRWSDPEARPACTEVATELFRGNMEDLIAPESGPEGFEAENHLDFLLDNLRIWGSRHVRGFMKPEGVVLFHVAANQLFKVLLENDDTPKGNS